MTGNAAIGEVMARFRAVTVKPDSLDGGMDLPHLGGLTMATACNH
jgi:hypothetical protein